MTEPLAIEIAETTRQKFWGRAPSIDGKRIIEPENEEERQSIPIPIWDILYIALRSSLIGDATRCRVEASLKSLDAFQRTFYRHYPEEKQIQFAIAYSIMVHDNVFQRLKNKACPAEKKEALRKSLAFIEEKSPPKQ